MIVKCSWCFKFMYEKEPIGNPMISGGLCAKCRPILDKQIDSMPKIPVRPLSRTLGRRMPRYILSIKNIPTIKQLIAGGLIAKDEEVMRERYLKGGRKPK